MNIENEKITDAELVDETVSEETPESVKKDKTLPQPSLLEDVARFITRTWTLFKERWFALILTHLIPMAVGFLVLAVLATVFTAMNKAVGSNPSWYNVISFGIFATVLGLCVLYVSVWSSVALITIAGSEEPLTYKQAFKKSRPFIWSYFFVSVINFCIIGGAVFLFIIPAIIIGIYFVFSYWVLIFEKENGARALARSYMYVKGSWWTIFVHALCLTLVWIIAFMIPGLFNAIHLYSVSQFLEMLLRFFFTIFLSLYFASLYPYIKERSAAHRTNKTITKKMINSIRYGGLAISLAGAVVFVAILYFVILPLLNLHSLPLLISSLR